jgi:hypothetical protein
MQLGEYVDRLRRELAVAAEAGGDETRAVAERLIAALESATRLTLLEALSTAADEITRELAPGSVDVRLRGRDPDFVVTPPPAARPYEEATADRDVRPPASPGPQPDAEEGGTARISLRIPEHLKPRVEEAAAQDGLSVNSWLVRAVAAALEPDAGRRRAGHQTAPSDPASPMGGRHFTGWVR